MRARGVWHTACHAEAAPSWPRAPEPHTKTVEWTVTASEWHSPAATHMKRSKAAPPRTRVGAAVSAVLPIPSCPYAFRPHANSPSRRPVQSVCECPHAMSSPSPDKSQSPPATCLGTCALPPLSPVAEAQSHARPSLEAQA